MVNFETCELKSLKEMCPDLSSAMISFFIFLCQFEVGITSKRALPIVNLACKVNFDLLWWASIFRMSLISMTLQCDCQIRSHFRAMSMLNGTSLDEALHRSPKKPDNYQLRISLHQLKSFDMLWNWLASLCLSVL